LIRKLFQTFLKQSQKNGNLSFVLLIRKRAVAEKVEIKKEIPRLPETKSGKLKFGFEIVFFFNACLAY